MSKLELFTAIACCVSLTLGIAWMFYPPLAPLALAALGVQMGAVVAYTMASR